MLFQRLFRGYSAGSDNGVTGGQGRTDNTLLFGYDFFRNTHTHWIPIHSYLAAGFASKQQYSDSETLCIEETANTIAVVEG